jgi:hypothetical protein
VSTQHEENAKELIQQGRAIVGTFPDQAQALAALAGAEAALALVEQQKIINEIALLSEANFEHGINPTDDSVNAWMADLYKRVRGDV